MTLDEFMTWLHEDRNNWARCEPGELLNRLEDAYDQLEALRKYAPRRINTIEELDTLPHNSIVIDRDDTAWQHSDYCEMWGSTKDQYIENWGLLEHYVPLHVIYTPKETSR